MRGSDLKARLLDAAIQQIREHGRPGFSLRGTARAAGVDPAMVYRQFADKDALMEEVALAAFARLAERGRDAVGAAGDDRVAKLLALGRAYVGFALDHPTEFEVMFAGGKRAAIPTDAPSAYTQLAEILADLDRGGRLAIPLDEAALLCWSAVHGAAWLVRDRGLVGYPTHAPDQVVDVVVGRLLGFLIR